MSLSQSERSYILKGVSKGVRHDGRSPHEPRRLVITHADVPFSSGSARASLGLGGTNVLAIIKADLSSCSATGGGTLECAAQIHASADADARATSDGGPELAASILRILSAPGVLDLSSLIVQPNVWAWRISIDIVVLLDDGSLLDTAIAAVHAALRATRVPSLRVIKTEGGSELELNDDPGAAQMLPFINSLPVTVTLHLLSGRSIVDATHTEALCAEGTITVGVKSNDSIVYFIAQGMEGMQPHALHEAILAAPKLAQRTFKLLN